MKRPRFERLLSSWPQNTAVITPLGQQILESELRIVYPFCHIPHSLCHSQMETVCDPCWTCRSRRIQCDQSGTPCTKCEKAGMECYDKRPLRWVKGVAIRGKMQGRTHEGISSGAPVHPSKITKPAPSTPKKSFRALVRASASSSLPVTLQDPSMSHLDQTSKYYIDYCKISMPLIIIMQGNN
jgi:hypothetical protein